MTLIMWRRYLAEFLGTFAYVFFRERPYQRRHEERYEGGYCCEPPQKCALLSVAHMSGGQKEQNLGGDDHR